MRRLLGFLTSLLGEAVADAVFEGLIYAVLAVLCGSSSTSSALCTFPMAARKEAPYRELYAPGMRLLPGARELLERLRAAEVRIKTIGR
jgi:hypothetical protein